MRGVCIYWTYVGKFLPFIPGWWSSDSPRWQRLPRFRALTGWGSSMPFSLLFFWDDPHLTICIWRVNTPPPQHTIQKWCARGSIGTQYEVWGRTAGDRLELAKGHTSGACTPEPSLLGLLQKESPVLTCHLMLRGGCTSLQIWFARRAIATTWPFL